MLNLRNRWLVLVAMTAFVIPLGSSARGADLEQVNGSLKQIPADAAFYSSSLRNGEQYQAVVNSRAWAKLTSLPVWKTLLTQLRTAPQQEAAYLKLLDAPENQQLLKLLGEMVSDEVFFYGGPNCTKFVDVSMQVWGGMRYGPLLAQLSGQHKEPGQAQIAFALQVLAQNLDLIQVPDLVIGFKIRNKEPAEAQLKRLEDVVNGLIARVPMLQGRFKRSKSAAGDLLVLTLDGSMVPWDQIPFEDLEEKKGQFDNLVKKLKGLKVTISLGVRGDYLLLSIGESTEVLQASHGEKRLLDRPELKPLTAYADKRLTSISYVSKELRSKVGLTAQDVDGWVELATQLLKQADLSGEQRDRLHKDLEKVAKDVKGLLVEPGALVGFSFLNERGMEGYAYDWTAPGKGIGTKPLTLLNHLGGAPLMAFVGRSEGSLETYQMVVNWLKVAHRDFEEIVLPKLDDDVREKYDQIAKPLLPLLERLDRATRVGLLPALAQGEGAFVLDGKLKSKQWFKAMPPADKPLPMLEPAFVWGVSHAGLLRQAAGEYRLIFNDLMAKLHELNPQIPDLNIPQPETKSLEAGKMYYYPIPETLGLDPQIQPNGGLSDKVAVLSISQEHTERLLATKPLHIDGGPLAETNKPLVSAAYVHWEGMVGMLIPWAQYGIHAIQSRAREDGAQAPQWVEMLDQIPAALEVLKVFRTYTSTTYIQDNATVTHSETVIRDL
jgi:hypothetical protein